MERDNHSRQIDDLLNGAQEALTELTTAAKFRGSSPSTCAAPSDDPTAVTIELARRGVSADALLGLKAGNLLSLRQAPSPSVELFRNGEKVADGILLVDNGRLAVRIQNLFREESK